MDYNKAKCRGTWRKIGYTLLYLYTIYSTKILNKNERSLLLSLSLLFYMFSTFISMLCYGIIYVNGIINLFIPLST